MLELKLARLMNKAYKASLQFGIKSVERRDAANLKRLDRELETATAMRNLATRLVREAYTVEDKANQKHDTQTREINTAYNLLSNALDDSNVNL